MTTFSEFVSSPELEKMIGDKKYPKYKIKFSNIIKKANIGDSDITDTVAINKLQATRSWNWFGFLFNLYWAIFCKIKLGWMFFVPWIIVLFIEDSGILKIEAPLSGIYLLAMSIAFGMSGNVYYFKEIINKYNDGYREKMPTSFLHLFIAIAVVFAQIAISMYLFPAQF